MPPKAFKGEYIETVCLLLIPPPPHPTTPQYNPLTNPGHGEQNLPPRPNPRHAAHYPRRENSHPSRCRDPGRPVPHLIIHDTSLLIHHRRPKRRRSGRSTSTYPVRFDNSRPVQLHLQSGDPAPAVAPPPRPALLLPAENRRSCVCRRARGRRGRDCREPCAYRQRDCYRRDGDLEGLHGGVGWGGCPRWYGGAELVCCWGQAGEDYWRGWGGIWR